MHHRSLPEARGQLARPALPGHEQRDQRHAQDPHAATSRKKELSRDLEQAVEFDQSQLFKKIYENEFGTPGGEPYGALIGDYEFTNHPEDIETARDDVQRRGRGLRARSSPRAGAEAVRLRRLDAS